MVELAIRGRKIIEPKPKKDYKPYAVVAGLTALILAVPFLMLPEPAGPVLLATGKDTIISQGPPQFCEEFPKNTDLLSLFPVETNSVVDSMELNQSIRLLTICVHGADDTNGYSRILVPKNVLGEQLRVTLDNQPVNANIQDFGQYYLVSLDYDHSERVIRITGEPQVIPQTPEVPRNGTDEEQQQQQQQQVVIAMPGAPAIACCPVDPPADPPPPADPCLPARPTYSVIGTGIPVIFTPGEKPSFSKEPDGSGIRVQASTRSVVNFISDVGETVGVVFKLDNLSNESTLIMIRVISSDSMLVDLIPSNDITTLRPISFNLYIAQINGDAEKAELEARVTAVRSGFHAFIMEIQPIAATDYC